MYLKTPAEVQMSFWASASVVIITARRASAVVIISRRDGVRSGLEEKGSLRVKIDIISGLGVVFVYL